MSEEPTGHTLPVAGEMLNEAAPVPASVFESTSDRRAESNVMRHKYKVLSDEEKVAMETIKDMGLGLHRCLDALGQSRELSLAKTKVEEAVMWGVKHITR